jgi:hypothetical protein
VYWDETAILHTALNFSEMAQNRLIARVYFGSPHPPRKLLPRLFVTLADELAEPVRSAKLIRKLFSQRILGRQYFVLRERG